MVKAANVTIIVPAGIYWSLTTYLEAARRGLQQESMLEEMDISDEEALRLLGVLEDYLKDAVIYS